MPTYVEMSIKSRIIEARKAAGLTQAELAKLVGVNVYAIRGWERGRYKPQARNIAKICNALKISYEWLSEGKGSVRLDLHSPTTIPEILADYANALADAGVAFQIEPKAQPDPVSPSFFDNKRQTVWQVDLGCIQDGSDDSDPGTTFSFDLTMHQSPGGGWYYKIKGEIALDKEDWPSLVDQMERITKVLNWE
jgi:transcriptional regulator with XRE-family HTH domain